MVFGKDIQVMQLPILKGRAYFDQFWTDLLPIVLSFWDLESSSSLFPLSSHLEEMAAVPIERQSAAFHSSSGNARLALHTQHFALLCAGNGIVSEILGKFRFLGFWHL